MKQKYLLNATTMLCLVNILNDKNRCKNKKNNNKIIVLIISLFKIGLH